MQQAFQEGFEKRAANPLGSLIGTMTKKAPNFVAKATGAAGSAPLRPAALMGPHATNVPVGGAKWSPQGAARGANPAFAPARATGGSIGAPLQQPVARPAAMSGMTGQRPARANVSAPPALARGPVGFAGAAKPQPMAPVQMQQTAPAVAGPTKTAPAVQAPPPVKGKAKGGKQQAPAPVAPQQPDAHPAPSVQGAAQQQGGVRTPPPAPSRARGTKRVRKGGQEGSPFFDQIAAGVQAHPFMAAGGAAGLGYMAGNRQ